MKDLKIITKLNTEPDCSCTCCCSNKYSAIITKGATLELTFNFDDYSYLKPADGQPWYDYIEQMTFLFKFGHNKLVSYKLFTENKPLEGEPELDSHFSYNKVDDCISFLINSAETAELPLTACGEFEIAINVDTDKIIGQKRDSIIIEKQLPVAVVDSLYNEAGLAVEAM